MKIVQVVHGFPPKQVGSIENYTYEISRRLAKSHQLHVYARDSNDLRPRYSHVEEEIGGIHVTRLNNPLTFQHYRRYDDAKVAKGFKELLNDRKPDLVHVQHLWGLSASILSACNAMAVPVVMTLHDYWLVCRRMSLLKPDLQLCSGPGSEKCLDCRLMELRRLGFPELVRYGCRLVPEHFWDSASETAAQRMLRGRSPLLDQLLFTHSSRTRYLAETAKAVDLFIAPSKFVRDVYEDLGFPRRSIMICPHGVRGDRFVNQTKSKSGKVRFAYIGSVDEHKGLHVLVRAFNRLVGKDAELRIWGAIPNPRYLRELRLLNENPNLQFMGYCDDAASILLGTDVLVVPSIMYESFSVATREAFLTGTPVIASSIGALPEVVAEGVNGFMFPPSDWVRLAICMLRFVEDPELVSRMQRNMPVVKTIDEHVQELECIYDEVIRSSNAGKLDQLSPGI